MQGIVFIWFLTYAFYIKLFGFERETRSWESSPRFFSYEPDRPKLSNNNGNDEMHIIEWFMVHVFLFYNTASNYMHLRRPRVQERNLIISKICVRPTARMRFDDGGIYYTFIRIYIYIGARSCNNYLITCMRYAWIIFTEYFVCGHPPDSVYTKKHNTRDY